MSNAVSDNPLGLPLTWDDVGECSVPAARQLLRTAFSECMRIAFNARQSSAKDAYLKWGKTLLCIIPCTVLSAAESEPDSEEAQMMALELRVFLMLVLNVNYVHASQVVGTIEAEGRRCGSRVLWNTHHYCSVEWFERINQLAVTRGGSWKVLAGPESVSALVNEDPIRAMNELNDVRAAVLRVDLKPVREIREDPEAQKFLTAFFRED